jgi:hypothetical protein
VIKHNEGKIRPQLEGNTRLGWPEHRLEFDINLNVKAVDFMDNYKCGSRQSPNDLAPSDFGGYGNELSGCMKWQQYLIKISDGWHLKYSAPLSCTSAASALGQGHYIRYIGPYENI